MASLPRRFRSETSATAQPTSTAYETLRGLVDSLGRDVASSSVAGYPEIPKLLERLRLIRQHVTASTSAALQDDFRHARGFESVLAVLRAFSGYYDPHKRSEPDMLSLFTLLGDCLGVLSAVLKHNSGNRRFFRYLVEGGGWEALEQVIASIGLGGAELDPWAGCRLFGKLLAFSLDDAGLDVLCQSTAEALRSDRARGPSHADEGGVDAQNGERWHLAIAHSAESISPAIRQVVRSTTMIRFPEMLRAVVSFWMAIPRPQHSSASPSSVLVLETILCATSASLYNRATVHSTGVLSQFLQVAFGRDVRLAHPERQKLLAICKLLMFFGVNRPADTQFLLSLPGSEASDFCLEMMAQHVGPPFFQFDLSLNGHSSLELPSLGRPFPPQSTGGYTFTAWIRIDSFDPTAHTTIFGVFDASQTCFLLIYIERDTYNLILQTSVFSNKPSVRFKSAVFVAKRWYHIAVVHRRPKAMTASKASLYVNGDFAEQVRCSYPNVPPLLNSSAERFVSFNSSQNRTNPVQAFVGTPRELSGRADPGVVTSQWSLASAHLFEDVLTDDYLAVLYGLGPRYQGNFQDKLGGFQTYEASAALGLRNEIVHPGKDEDSEILRAVRDKASSLLPESKILFSILPTATFPEHVQYMDTGVLRSLPRASIRNLFHMSSQEGSPLAVNCAFSSLSDALFRANGIASFRGAPLVAVPSHLDENLWRLAGFTPLALKLLERASTAEDIVRAIEIVFHCIRGSWRNSDAMEKDNGYSILGMILRFKIGLGGPAAADVPVSRLKLSGEDRDSLTFRVLSLVLNFVGYNHVDHIESFIVNPLAYRILLIDLDIWRRSAPRTQEMFYRQFVTFAVNTKHHDFNSRRLIRMRMFRARHPCPLWLTRLGIVKRLLDSIRGDSMSEDVLDHFMKALEALVRTNLSQEVLRSLSLFVSYAFYTPSPATSRSSRPLSAVSRSSTPGFGKRGTGDFSRTHSPLPESKQLPKKLLGKHVLSMYSDVICGKGSINNIKKFARAVTNKVSHQIPPQCRDRDAQLDKWLLYLLANDDGTVVLHGCKILARVLVTQGPAYTSKFAGKSGGFIIMADRLKRFWDVPTLWPICFSVLFGCDVADIDFSGELEVEGLLGMFGDRKIVYPEALILVTSLLQHGMKEVIRHQEDPDSPAKIYTPASAVKDSSRPYVSHHGLPLDLDKALESRCWCLSDYSKPSANLCPSDVSQNRRTSNKPRRRLGNSHSVLAENSGTIARVPRLCPGLRMGSHASPGAVSRHCWHRRGYA